MTITGYSNPNVDAWQYLNASKKNSAKQGPGYN
jgi:hypothetical protein